jgi:hypothetical protein
MAESGNEYNIIVEKKIGNTWIEIVPSQYIFDRDAGILTIYGSNPEVNGTNPPRISFWRYEGLTLSSPGSLLGDNIPTGSILFKSSTGEIGGESLFKVLLSGLKNEFVIDGQLSISGVVDPLGVTFEPTLQNPVNPGENFRDTCMWYSSEKNKLYLGDKVVLTYPDTYANEDFMGPTGDRGFTGATGTSGAIGTQGFTGATGPKGDVGPVGPGVGDTGPTGQRGLDGVAGPQGFTGPMGPAGPAGSGGGGGGGGGGSTTAINYASYTINGPITLPLTTSGNPPININPFLNPSTNVINNIPENGITLNTTTGNITVSTAGYYNISAYANIATATNSAYTLYIYQNNNLIRTEQIRSPTTGSFRLAITYPIYLTCAANDYFKIEVSSSQTVSNTTLNEATFNISMISGALVVPQSMQGSILLNPFRNTPTILSGTSLSNFILLYDTVNNIENRIDLSSVINNITTKINVSIKVCTQMSMPLIQLTYYFKCFNDPTSTDNSLQSTPSFYWYVPGNAASGSQRLTYDFNAILDINTHFTSTYKYLQCFISSTVANTNFGTTFTAYNYIISSI